MCRGGLLHGLEAGVAAHLGMSLLPRTQPVGHEGDGSRLAGQRLQHRHGLTVRAAAVEGVHVRFGAHRQAMPVMKPGDARICLKMGMFRFW